MPTHDIIDNRREKLADHIKQILCTSNAARFAVGYFFLSGFDAIGDTLGSVGEIRLLIGNTTNRETLEHLTEGYRRLELVTERLEGEAYPKRVDTQRMVERTGDDVRCTMELMDQTDDAEVLLRTMVRMIEEKRLHVKVYTRGRMHAKAYIFDYGPIYDQSGKQLERLERGIAIVGSSNLTISGVTHNTELNVVVQGNDNHGELVRWFDELWEEAEDFDETLMHEIQQSWAIAPASPYDIYMKTLYELVKDRLEIEDDKDILWDDEITSRLADFQKVAVRNAVQMIRDYGGAFVADVVGLGKSYIGSAVIKHFRRTQGLRPLVICPATLVDMWERYNQVYDLGAVVVSMGYLTERSDKEGRRHNFLLEDDIYSDRDLIMVDESHNFRHQDTQRYRLLHGFLASGRHCCFLTATPRNKSVWDVYNQIKLFHQADKTDLPIDPPDLKQYFRMVEHEQRTLPSVLSHVLVRRTRNHILKWYGYDSQTHERVNPARFDEYRSGHRRAYIIVAGKHQFFPKRELETIEYSIEHTYQGLYQELRGYLGKPRRGRPKEPLPNELTYARYGLWHYVIKSKQKKEPYVTLQRAGANLCGLMRILLFKRFESSVEAFRLTVRRLKAMHETFLVALDEGIVAAGKEAQRLLYEYEYDDEQQLLDELREVTEKYDAKDFDVDALRRHVQHDIALLELIDQKVTPISAEEDAKLQTLLQRLTVNPLDVGKCLIFTQFADTARYLHHELRAQGWGDELEVIYSGDKSKQRVVGRFAPKANPEYQFRPSEVEIQTLVATDVLAEGLNLQDCDKLINYDLHWNPVRLIQRFGRIDRIGSEHGVVYGFNFLPETEMDRHLGLKQILMNRIQEIHDTIGEDAAILDPSEQLNEESMYAIYEQKGEQLSLFDDGEEQFVDINEAEEVLRQLRRDDEGEYQRIASLRDGIRSAMVSDDAGTFVFCAADRYQQLYLVAPDGTVRSQDVPRVLGSIRCSKEEPTLPVSPTHNSTIMAIKRKFADEVRHREAERRHTVSLTQAQRYVLRELRVLFEATRDDDLRGQINTLEGVFRSNLQPAVNRELGLLRKNAVTGPALLSALTTVFQQHGLQRLLDPQFTGEMRPAVPRIVCSEGLL